MLRVPPLGERVRHILNIVGVVLGYLVAFASAGCTDLRPVIATADATRATGHALAAVVDEVCAKPYAAAADLPEEQALAEVIRLDRLRCPEALRAQTALSEAHGALVALIGAIQAGQCQATVASPAPARCSLVAASTRLVEASARLARAVDALGRQ
jgi:hypothetical protein